MATTVCLRHRQVRSRTFAEVRLTSESGGNPLSAATVEEVRDAPRRRAAPGCVVAHTVAFAAARAASREDRHAHRP